MLNFRAKVLQRKNLIPALGHGRICLVWDSTHDRFATVYAEASFCKKSIIFIVMHHGIRFIWESANDRLAILHLVAQSCREQSIILLSSIAASGPSESPRIAIIFLLRDRRSLDFDGACPCFSGLKLRAWRWRQEKGYRVRNVLRRFCVTNAADASELRAERIQFFGCFFCGCK